MSDTIRWMRLWPALAVLTACGSDPTLEVVVTHATGPTVAYTTVTVYQSASMSCEDVEFARLDAVQLDALAVTEETIDATGAVTGELTGMSRTENKVIVARDFDADDALVAINCVQKGEVVGNDVVEIQTIIAAQVSLKPPIDVGDLAVAVSLTNSHGTPIADARPVSWTIYGPLGSTAANPSNVTSLPSMDGDWQPTKPTCADNGLARLHPNPPSIVGGYAVQVRPAWAVALPPLYTSLTATSFAVDPKPKASNALRHYCAIQRHATTRHVVCIDETAAPPKSFQYTVSTSGGAATLSNDTGTLINGLGAQTVVAVVAVAPSAGSDDRDVYAVTDRGVLVPLYGAPPPTDSNPVCALGCIDDAIAVPNCGSIKGKVLMRAPILNQVRAIDAHGGNAQTFTLPVGGTPTLDNAGCVDQVSATGTAPGQFATIHLTVGTAIAATFLAACTNVACGVAMNNENKPVLLTRGASVGFSRENRMILTTVDATGVVLVRAKLAVNNGIIEDPPRMSAVAIPEHVVVGKFDGDTNLGTVWNVSARLVGTSFEIAYHRTIGNTGLPVEALSALQSVTVSDLEADDLDGDGFDDLLITTTDGVVVVPLSSAIPAPGPNTDPTCAP